jgi:broad specificity phosphatase PhoE
VAAELPVDNRIRVWCLRHAESENVTAGIAGAVPTSPLTDRGRRQTVDAARALAAEPIAAVYSSTALRARQTAAFLGLCLALLDLAWGVSAFSVAGGRSCC